MIFNIISIYFLIMAFLVIYFTARFSVLNRPGLARIVVLLSLAACCYILGYTMELNADSPSQILFWNRVEYIGIPFVSALWLMAALIYMGHFVRCKALLSAAMFLIPAISLILRLTNDYHHFYFASVRFETEYGKLILVKTMGPWMYVQLFHSMLMIFVTLGLYVHGLVKDRKRETGKMVFVAAASGFAAAGLFSMLTNPFRVRIDYMALCLPVSCILIIAAMLRYDFLETKSVARSKVFEASESAILLINKRNKIIDYNRSAKQLFEKMGIRISNRYLAVLLEGDSVLLKSLTDTGPAVVQVSLNGETAYFNVSTWGIDGNPAHGWIKILHDVTEICQLNKSLERQAMMDELSGLSNRRAFIQTAQEMLLKPERGGAGLYLMMMDLDNFKKVNDRYGHQMGDRVIERFGKLLRENFGADCLTARIGGEEFAVLLPGADDAQISKKAAGILQSMRLCEYAASGEKFYVTASIGITKWNRPAQTLDELIKTADDALYESKKRGRNCSTWL